jgi:hypothetical protein
MPQAIRGFEECRSGLPNIALVTSRYPFGNFRFHQVLRASHGLPAAIESLLDLLASGDSLMILSVSPMATPIDAVANWDAELKKK